MVSKTLGERWWDGNGRVELGGRRQETRRWTVDAVTVVREGSATVVNVGMSKLGGPTVAQQAAQIASAGGLGVMVGGVIELGVATAMGLHLAAALPDLADPST
jgi:muconate cycloisomerase